MNEEQVMISNDGHYDVIIIGTGAGGGTLAQTGAHRQEDPAPGARRLCAARERNWNTRAVNVEGKYQTKEIWRDRDGKELHPHTNYCVGGNTKFYGAALFRLRSEDFRRDPAPRRRLAGLADLLRRAGTLLHAGRAALPRARPARRRSDRTARQRAYPHPAVSHEPRIQQLSDDFAAAGLKPFHTPLGVMLDEKIRTEQMHPLQHLRRLSVPGVCEVRRTGARRRSGAGVSRTSR